MSIKQQIAWLARGGHHTRAALDDHAEAIRALQAQVADLTAVVARIEPEISRVSDEWEALPVALRAAVDDLSARIGALGERVDADRAERG